MENKIRVRLVMGLFTAVVCLVVLFPVQTKATDAFVVEEETVIGGPESPVVAPPVIVQPPTPKQAPEKKAEKITEKTSKKTPEELPEEPAEEPETISHNTVQPVFRVPVRRKEAERALEKPRKELSEEKKQDLSAATKETETVSRETTDRAWTLIIVGGIFLLAGIIRILYRLCIRYGKL